MKALRDCTELRQLTPESVNALIRRIEVHSKDRESKKVRGAFDSPRGAVYRLYGKGDAGGNGGNTPKPAAVKALCIKRNTVQPIFGDYAVST